MGKYNGAVVTTAGESVIAQALQGTKLTWTKRRTSSVAVAAANVKALTALTGVEQTTNITDASVYSGNIVQVSARFSSQGVAAAYLIRTVGIYGQLAGGSETLIAVMTAVTPDEMPVYDADAPSAFIFTNHLTVQDAASITMGVNDAGTATVADCSASWTSPAATCPIPWLRLPQRPPRRIRSRLPGIPLKSSSARSGSFLPISKRLWWGFLSVAGLSPIPKQMAPLGR